MKFDSVKDINRHLGHLAEVFLKRHDEVKFEESIIGYSEDTPNDMMLKFYYKDGSKGAICIGEDKFIFVDYSINLIRTDKGANDLHKVKEHYGDSSMFGVGFHKNEDGTFSMDDFDRERFHHALASYIGVTHKYFYDELHPIPESYQPPKYLDLIIFENYNDKQVKLSTDYKNPTERVAFVNELQKAFDFLARSIKSASFTPYVVEYDTDDNCCESNILHRLRRDYEIYAVSLRRVAVGHTSCYSVEFHDSEVNTDGYRFCGYADETK